MNKYTHRLVEDELTIFLFHGVINENNSGIRNYTEKHILSKDFSNLLKQLYEKGTPVSLDEVANKWEQNCKLPKFPYAITFDDGFENNLTVALPILKRYLTPATFYVTTKFINENEMSWVDKVEACVDASSKQSLTYKGLFHDFEIVNNDSKINFMNKVRNHVKNTSHVDADEFAKEICKSIQLENEPTIIPEIDNKLTWEQIKIMDKSDLVSIGGHSHTHRIMSHLSKQELENEISLSLDLLKTNLEKSIHHYSYPEGQSNSYSKDVIKVLKEYGIKICPTAIDGTNPSFSDLFHLKRIMIP
tara:strand:+ start:42132 stop:43040 length:909 start_codon:yes stop_codon:yes gene_type:complete